MAEVITAGADAEAVGSRGALAPPLAQDAKARVAALEAKVRRDLQLLDYPKRSWVPPRRAQDGSGVLDVLIVGGGQGGLAAAFALMREKVERVLVVDANPRNLAGPWKTFARMRTLRTPKHVLGPELGIPDLSVRAWFEARYGDGSWERAGNIPKDLWAEYLCWVRDLVGIPVRSETSAGAIAWSEPDRCFRVPVTHAGETTVLYARKVVLATGIQGSGDWYVPPFISDALPKALWAHTHEAIDFARLVGKRVAVLGAGASAFDNAAVALEEGAAKVDLFFRRPELVRVNVYRWAEFTGFLKHHGDLPDAEKWRFVHRFLTMGQLPPAPTFARATRHDGFTLHPGSPWEAVRADGDEVVITTPHGTSRHDFIIAGTGFRTNLASRRELTEVAPHAATWADRYTAPEALAHADMARHPYLGPGFQLVEKTPGAAPWLGGIFNYTFGCLLSLGLGGASISGMKYSLPRLVGEITKQLYLEDIAIHYDSLTQYDQADF